MKLKFELKRTQIEHLYKILQLVSHIWSSSDRILFYFDNDQMIIYPEEKGGFDKIYARIHILNQSQKSGDGQHFFHNYNIKSQKDKNAILISIVKLPELIECLKVLVDLNYDALLKLTQMQTDNEIKKYLDILGSSPQKDVVRSIIEISCYFDLNMFPEQIAKKEVNFMLDVQTCQVVLQRFTTRLNIIPDDYGKICFKVKSENQLNGQVNNGMMGQNNSQLENEMQLGQQEYQLELYSKHMKNTVLDRGFQALFSDVSNMKGKYKVCLKKDIFQRFFSVLKFQGSAVLKINHKDIVELEYTIDKCPYIQVIFETPSRSI